MAAGWRLVGGWPWQALAGGWRLAGVPVPSVQFNRSILSVNTVGPYCRSKQSFQAGVEGGRRRLSFQAGVGGGRRAVVQGARWLSFKAGVGGGRSWATTRGQFCGCTIHETAKTAPNTQNSRSSSTKTSILCSKCPKTGVSKAKSAQKPRFCAHKDRDWHREERKLASGSAK